MQMRKLGYWETALCLLHDQLEGTGTVFSATHVRGQMDFTHFKQAWDLLFQRHPLLRVTIEQRSDGYYFKENAKFAAIPIQCISHPDPRHWETIVEQQLSELFPTEQYLWRVTLLQTNSLSANDYHIIFCVHHAIADGLSCVYLMNELLTYYKQISSKKTITITPLPLLNAVETLLSRQILVKMAKSTQDTTPKSIAQTPVFYQDYKPLGQRVTKQVYRIIRQADCTQLMMCCRQRKIKVNSAFNAAMLLTAQSMDQQPLHTALVTPVNLRPYCNPPIGLEHFGCYISCVGTQFALISDDSFWKLAQQYEQQLNAQIPKLALLPMEFNTANTSQLSTLLEIESARMRHQFTSGFCVTNKGYLPFPKRYGPLELISYFTSSSRQAGDLIINLSVTSMHHQTFCCFTYTEPLIKPEWAGHFADHYINILLDAVKSTPP
ncbi:condensation domain-containing protein [Legionella nagasakiensis]|uniref:condensation domain-containing protein n=1 Tax=Legionella nagasakiensis TaxID=535290 RepID=UPI00105526E1|nr:condensation domain-containing protein [Legionella nagasakiensis]